MNKALLDPPRVDVAIDDSFQNKPPRISVIVPVFNASPTLQRVIEGLELQNYDRSQFEIIMVDNNSTDDSTEILRRHPSIRHLSEPNQGSYAARNRGIAASTGEIIAFTDSDCIPRKDWLLRIDNAMKNPATSIVLGRRLAPHVGVGVSMLSQYQHTRDFYIFNSKVSSLYYGYTNNMAVRRKLFGESLFFERMRGSDATFVSNVVERTSVDSVQYDPEMLVTHLEITSTHAVFKKCFIYGKSQEEVDDASIWRPLTMLERFKVYSMTVRSHRLSLLQSAYLLTLLSIGVLSWVAGSVIAKLCILYTRDSSD